MQLCLACHCRSWVSAGPLQQVSTKLLGACTALMAALSLLMLAGLLGYAAVAYLSTREVVSGKPHADAVVRPVLLTGGAVLASCSSYLL